MLGCNRFSAGERHWPPWIKTATADKRCMLMKGTVIDTIRVTAQLGDPDLARFFGGAPQEANRAMVPLVSRLLVAAGAKNVYEHTGEPMVNAVARTLLVDSVSSTLTADQILEGFRKYARHYLPTDESCAWLRTPPATAPEADGAASSAAEESMDGPEPPSKEFERAL